MSRRPIGDTAMSVAERSRRKRARAKALRDAAPMPDVVGVQGNGSEPVGAITTPPVAEVFPGDYPRMLYNLDGRTCVAETAEQHEQLTLEGWGTVPLVAHRQRQPTVHGALGADPMAMMIQQAVREVFDEYDLVPAPATGRLSSVSWRPAGKR